MSQSENGNLQYEIYFPLDSDDDICLIEKWETEEDILAHQKSLHFAILGELKEKYVDKVEIQKYWIEQQ